MKKYFLILLALAPMWSCDDFLEEKQVSTLTQDYYNTEGGLENLIKGLYTYARSKHEWDAYGARLIETETDAYMNQDNRYATISNDAYSSNGLLSGSLYNFLGAPNSNDYAPIGAYPHINNCNIALEQIENVKPGKFGTDAALSNTRKAEVLFLRAWAYYLISNQFGGVPLLLTGKRVDDGIYYYPKSNLVTIYKQIIKDMRFAYENLPLPDPSNRGRVNKLAAGHFLAKLYLNRAQAAAFEGMTSVDNRHLGMLFKGNVSTDLDSVITIATEVISAGGGLAPDYWNLFNPQVSESSPHSEVLWAAQFDANLSLNGRFGNRSVNYHVGAYEINTHVNRRGNLDYGRPFATFKPTDWGYDNFRDKVNDSRYDKTFRAEFIGTTLTGNSPTSWSAAMAAWWNANKPAEEPTVTAGQLKGTGGKRALLFIENSKDDALDSATVVGQPYVLAARWIHSPVTDRYYYRLYPNNALASIGLNTSIRNVYMGSKKLVDPNRGGGAFNSENGTRDVILMRLAETYLIRAEAYGRKGQYANAVADINVLRARASYKPGENRPSYMIQWQPEAAALPAAEKVTPYPVTADTYSALTVTENHFTSSTPEADAEEYIPTVTTKEDMFIHFIYNEKAREFLSEGLAWEDLHNAGILYDRVMYLNQMASNMTGLWPVADNPQSPSGQNGNGKGQYQRHHTFRPWPNQFLDLLTDESGRPLDAEAKAAYQNPGY